MPQENIDAVRRVYDALNRGDWDSVFREADADFEVTTQRGPNSGTHSRRAAVQGFGEDYLSAFDDMAFEPEEFVEAGDQVVVFLTRRARAKGGDAEMVVRNAHVWKVRAGVIHSMTSFPDPEEARQAVGLTE